MVTKPLEHHRYYYGDPTLNASFLKILVAGEGLEPPTRGL